MRVSVTVLRRTGLRLGAISLLSALFISLSVEPSPAQEPARIAPQVVPGQVTEMVSPAATVVSTAHYQALVGLECKGSLCSGNLPNVRRQRRLNITRVTCQLQPSEAGAFLLTGFITLVDAKGVNAQYQFLPPDYTLSSPTTYLINRAVDLQIAAREHASLLFLMTGLGGGATCSVSGTLDTLG